MTNPSNGRVESDVRRDHASILWLGAHKTGTTYLQRCLDASAERLVVRGVGYIGLDDFRSRYTRPLLYEGHDRPPDEPFDRLDQRVALIFDENIPGLVQHAIRPTGLYPEAAHRARRIADYLRLDVTDVVLGIRSYDAFIPSLYCETLKSVAFRPFLDYLHAALSSGGQARLGSIADVYDQIDFGPLDWYQLLDRLATEFPSSALRVYLHEELRGNEARLLSLITKTRVDDITTMAARTRVGFSGSAVAALEDLAHQREVRRADVRAAVDAYPVGHDHPPFSPWDAETRSRHRNRYDEHVAAIEADARFDLICLGARRGPLRRRHARAALRSATSRWWSPATRTRSQPS